MILVKLNVLRVYVIIRFPRNKITVVEGIFITLFLSI